MLLSPAADHFLALFNGPGVMPTHLYFRKKLSHATISLFLLWTTENTNSSIESSTGPHIFWYQKRGKGEEGLGRQKKGRKERGKQFLVFSFFLSPQLSFFGNNNELAAFEPETCRRRRRQTAWLELGEGTKERNVLSAPFFFLLPCLPLCVCA